MSHPSFAEAFRFWLKLGFISFGGPAGQISIMHEELVTKRRWISERRFLHALNYCMMLPGPEAQQLATYVGWLLHRTLGGIVAGGLFFLPAVVLLWGLAWIYVEFGTTPLVESVFHGLKPAVVAIIAVALFNMGRNTLKRPVKLGIAVAALAAIALFGVPFPAIVLGAGVVGFVTGRASSGRWLGHDPSVPGPAGGSALGDDGEAPEHVRPSGARAVRVLVSGLVVWWVPVLAFGLWLGWQHTLVTEGVFFSKVALVTFGGAYAVLAYVAQQTVERYQWLAPGEMLDGLGLAESTPGPLIMVVQFVGFLGGWNHPGGLSPLAAATLGALITTWVTFVPCFIWILLGGPWIERLRGLSAVTHALGGVTAAVVGVIANLAVWFGVRVIWPDGGPDLFALGVMLAAAAALATRRVGVVMVVAGGAAAGLIRGVV